MQIYVTLFFDKMTIKVQYTFINFCFDIRVYQTVTGTHAGPFTGLKSIIIIIIIIIIVIIITVR